MIGASLAAVGVAIAIGQAFGRWGNFFNQEAYGVPITNPSFQFFPAAVWIEDQAGWFAATFFYESAWCFLIVAFLLIMDADLMQDRQRDNAIARRQLHTADTGGITALEFTHIIARKADRFPLRGGE